MPLNTVKWVINASYMSGYIDTCISNKQLQWRVIIAVVQ